MTKDQIIAEIRRTAEENDGVALGAERFSAETGIGIGTWRGKFWGAWSEAVVEAGLAPNRPNEAHAKGHLLECLIALLRRNKRFPTYSDVRMARQADPSFPAHQAFAKLGSRDTRIAMVRAHAADRPEFRDVLELVPEAHGEAEPAPGDDAGDGAVYLLKLGKHYKIGKSYRVPQRHREIAVELPEKPDVIHVIATDDPSGIERYWHTRFAAKRTNGEWFLLDREDVRAFKRRKFM